jgi:hypothetical protein
MDLFYCAEDGFGPRKNKKGKPQYSAAIVVASMHRIFSKIILLMPKGTNQAHQQ